MCELSCYLCGFAASPVENRASSAFFRSAIRTRRTRPEEAFVKSLGKMYEATSFYVAFSHMNAEDEIRTRAPFRRPGRSSELAAKYFFLWGNLHLSFLKKGAGLEPGALDRSATSATFCFQCCKNKKAMENRLAND